MKQVGPNLEDLDNRRFLNPSVRVCWHQRLTYANEVIVFSFGNLVLMIIARDCHGVLWRSEDTSWFSPSITGSRDEA